jgi:hypothetical protein
MAVQAAPHFERKRPFILFMVVIFDLARVDDLPCLPEDSP